MGDYKFNLGMASFTLREFDLVKAAKMTKRAGLTHISLKSMHLPLDLEEDELKEKAAKVREIGLDLYGCGVVYMGTEEEVENAFKYAETAGMDIIIGVPEKELLDLVEEKVKEYDIKLAIHNHGPGDERYPSPSDVYKAVKDRDKRMGLCLDIGHTMRIKEDPIKAVEKYADRIHDLHVKDVSEASAEGGPVPMNRGVIDIPAFLRKVKEIGYEGVMGLEYEANPEDPLPEIAESVGFMKGVLSVI
ncbi:MAG: sugar phosphate isomerase/epimerase family protein [Halanaerobiaceae bacterium]